MDLLPGFSIETWSLLVALLGLLMLYGIWPYRVFWKLGVPGPTPLPFIGTLWQFSKGFVKFDTMCYEKYGKVWGIYDGRQPVLAVMDPQIIKTVLVKECYTNFTNRRVFGAAGILRSAVSVVQDEHWKNLRTLLSPTFTSGKLKEMFPIIKHYGEVFAQHVQKKVERDEPMVMKDIFGPYSIDVVTSTSFGVEVNSMENSNDYFIKEMKEFTKPFQSLSVKFALMLTFPFLVPVFNALNIQLFPKDSVDFFIKSFEKIKAARLKEGQASRVDFLQLMMNSQVSKGSPQSNGVNHGHKGLTDEEILAQSIMFVFAGYEPTSNALNFLAYALATHPDVQQKVQDEIDSVLPNKAPLTYDAIMQLEYLDMVMSESQRLYPLGGRIERVSKKDVEINGVTIPKGAVVMTSPYLLQRDPEFWPEPEEFRPERFSKENKDKIDPYTFLPFGAGPRNCIGMRFAQVTMKVAITVLLQRFSFRVCKETPIPLKMKNSPFLTPEKPIVLKLVPRDAS
nr:cytochrome P450 3A9-like isoform X2 [Pogona vitticeps]